MDGESLIKAIVDHCIFSTFHTDFGSSFRASSSSLFQDSSIFTFSQTHSQRRFNIPDLLIKAFVDNYYSRFDTNRASLFPFYQDSSMLTLEGEKIKGAANIVTKLISLPFQQCKHNITTVDCQPSGPAGGMLVFVSGTMQLAGEENLHKFTQMFHLMPTQQGSFYVFNDIFRLN